MRPLITKKNETTASRAKEGYKHTKLNVTTYNRKQERRILQGSEFGSERTSLLDVTGPMKMIPMMGVS